MSNKNAYANARISEFTDAELDLLVRFLTKTLWEPTLTRASKTDRSSVIREALELGINFLFARNAFPELREEFDALRGALMVIGIDGRYRALAWCNSDAEDFRDAPREWEGHQGEADLRRTLMIYRKVLSDIAKIEL